MYHLLRQLLFLLPPECAHDLALNGLKLAHHCHLLSSPTLPAEKKTYSVMGLSFPNRIGLAAGLDKNADYVDALAALGFGFIEIGTVTPKPQPGNAKPRLFRLVEQQAIINRMGFNSKGVDYVAEKLSQIKYRGILGVNLGKNKDTAIEYAVDDYLIGFRQLWSYASYVTINISSPNTVGLRDLQQAELLTDLLRKIKEQRDLIHQTQHKYIPLVVKIAPDLAKTELEMVASVLLDQMIDGIIATNTTIQRKGVENSLYAKEAGGLSGAPLMELSTQVVRDLHLLVGDRIPIIAAGGVMEAKSAQEKFAAGASLVQVYSGFIYHGPALIKQLIKM